VSDIGLTWDGTFADLSISQNDLASDEGLETSVLISLFTDRRAEPGDVLPDGTTDRRGWWADAAPVVADDRIGSRLWLLDRAKQTPDVLPRAEEYAREALQWMIEDRVTDRIDVTASFPRAETIGLEVSIYRPELDPVTYRFNYTWNSHEL
jgi:phage gp46-like protein